MSDYLGSNLKLLCSHYRSIAEVCRKLAINRAQFNKYLSGQSRPTAHNLKRICDFFGVEAYELNLPGEQFAHLIGARGGGLEQQAGGDPDRKSTRLNSSHSQISYAVLCLKK